MKTLILFNFLKNIILYIYIYKLVINNKFYNNILILINLDENFKSL